MCGIVGVVGNLNAKHEKAFKELLILDSLRGVDSTGAAIVSRNGDVNVVKAVGNPFELLDTKTFDKQLTKINKALIGHNRFATTGNVTRANAHPFMFDTVVGVHNGTLSNKYELDRQNLFSVDSQALLNKIDEEGPDVAIGMADGAWSIVYWDVTDQSVNFIRNRERPMWLAFTKDHEGLFFASERWMITIASSRNGIDLDLPFETEEDMFFKFGVSGLGKIEELQKRVIKGKAKGSFMGHPGMHSHRATNFGASSRIQTASGAGPNQSITPTGKVVTFPSQKKEVVEEGKGLAPSLVDGFINNYSGTTNKTFQVTGKSIDIHGSLFLSCFDKEEPNAAVRLYLKAKDNAAKYIGKDIVADVGKFHIASQKGVKEGYFKLEYGSHKFHKNSLQNEIVYAAADGELLNRADWQAKHGSCCWCTGAIEPTSKFRFVSMNSKHGDTLCEDCNEDPEIGAYPR